jgi:hypothetical protein
MRPDLIRVVLVDDHDSRALAKMAMAGGDVRDDEPHAGSLA